ncbi:MAG TPA: hypothetical protein P5076_02810, partial [Myxococcota bacterium]|nr:hypothetical protein [Myxococcota bacterium]
MTPHARPLALPCLLAAGAALLLGPGCLFGPDESDCWDSSDEMLAEDGSTIAVDGQALRADGTP